ncbi:MAG: glycosyltransferase [Thermoproteaceae archaeon]|nr:glycosyltransferase [Thermoproteaceae archaeon]
MAIFVGVPSYNRAKVLELCLMSFLGSRLVRGFIVVADAASASEAELYVNAIRRAMDTGFEVIHDVRVGRRGSARARNMILEIAKENLAGGDVLVMYDDDYLYPGDGSMVKALRWLGNCSVGVVGGRVVNLRRRRVDPDFALNVIPCMADALTRITGFIVLDTRHGPREVEYITPLMAMRVELLSRGVRYDESYGGTGYREESDFQRQVRGLGLKIIFEPKFYTYHLAAEQGGNRYSDLKDRMYWKWKNHIYFMNKWRYPVRKKALSCAILTVYAVLSGPPAVRGMVRAVTSRA